jgi:hypothetical protein
MPWDTTITDESDEYDEDLSTEDPYYGDDEYDDEWYDLYDGDGDSFIPYVSTPWERFSMWFRLWRYHLGEQLRDPLSGFRHCVKCGQCGCVPREVECPSCWLPF